MLSRKDFSFLIDSAPLVSIDLIVESEGFFLVGKRNNPPAKDSYFVPGGRIYKNEKLKDAFSRITLSELALDIKYGDSEFIGAYEHFYPDSAVSGIISTHYVVLAHKINLSTKPEYLPNDQHKDYQWLSRSGLLNNHEVHENTKAYFL